MNSYKKIKDTLRQHKKELIEKYKVKELGIFGSYVRNEQKKKSDVDILVEFKDVPDLFKFIEMERYLEGLIDLKVELVEKTALKPQLKDIILNEVIYV